VPKPFIAASGRADAEAARRDQLGSAGIRRAQFPAVSPLPACP
jgi:hypothetical protein